MDIDLYSDIDNVRKRINAENTMIEQVEARAEESELRAKKSKKEVTAYKLKAEQLKHRCTMLEKNLSCLFKTAWAHLHRKDMQIVDLKQQIKEFRKVTGMVAPGVKSGDLHMDAEMAATGAKAGAEANTANRNPRQMGPPHDPKKTSRSDQIHDGGAVRHLHSHGDCGAEAGQVSASQQPPSSAVRREAAERTAAAPQHRQNHTFEGDSRRDQQGGRDGLGRDVPHSQGEGSPDQHGKQIRGPRRDSSLPPCPRRDRPVRCMEQSQRSDRELQERDGKERDRGGRERDFRDRENRKDMRDSLERHNGRVDLRRAQGSLESRQRSGHTRQRRQHGRSRSRSPRG